MSNPTPAFGQKPQQKRSSQPFLPHDNIIETLRDVGSGITDTLKHDVIGNTVSNTINSLLGTQPHTEYGKNPFETPQYGSQQESPIRSRQPDILSPAHISREQAMVRQQIEAIRQELSLLAKELGSLHSEIEKTIAEVPVDPGIYHLNFFERLKAVIMIMRKSVHDSRSWLSLSQGKKKQQGYWGMYKKHGTKFGLSADRTPATQSG